MKEIRDIKLDLVMGNQNPIVDSFKELTDCIKIINCDVYNKDGLEFIYYNKEKEWIFYQDVKNEKFWCDYNRYWSVFENKLNLEYKETQAITKFLVEEALKRELDTPEMHKLKIQKASLSNMEIKKRNSVHSMSRELKIVDKVAAI